jgi:hypothetical protein
VLDLFVFPVIPEPMLDLVIAGVIDAQIARVEVGGRLDERRHSEKEK